MDVSAPRLERPGAQEGRVGHADQAGHAESPTFVTTAEQGIYREYDRQRRLRVARNISGFLCILVGTLSVLETLTYLVNGMLHSAPLLALLYTSADLTVTGVLAVAYLAARARRVNLATGLTLGVIVAATCFFCISENLLERMVGANSLLGFFSLVIGIVAVGLLGTLWQIIGVTLFINIYTLLAAYIIIPDATGQWPSAPWHGFPFALILLFVQLGVAALTIVGWLNYQQTFRALGDARVAAERARRLDELKSQFISSVNHELRNPVMAMLGYLELLEDPETRRLPELEDDLLARASQAGLNLRALLNNILDTRRLDQGASDFTPEEVDARATLESATTLIDPHEGKMAPRDLRLEMPTGLLIWGERTRLQQIFINLLSNALKYSAPGTPVEVRAWVTEEASQPGWRWGRKEVAPRKMVEMVFRDYGLGVPPEQIPLLFQRFTRLERDLTSNVVGNGLGLHLCRVFAEAMGGRIWVESSGVAGEGSAFHLRLPLPPTAGEEEAEVGEA